MMVQSCETDSEELSPSITQFDCSVFTGEYVTGGIDDDYLQHIEDLRNDNAKQKAEKQGSGPAMLTVNGASSSSSSASKEVNKTNLVLETQPLNDVTGGGEVAGGGDVSQAVGLANEESDVAEPPSTVIGLSNSGRD
ncbi:amidophosphoribosyltransferase [Rhodosporidiobolus nylandii]